MTKKTPKSEMIDFIRAAEEYRLEGERRPVHGRLSFQMAADCERKAWEIAKANGFGNPWSWL